MVHLLQLRFGGMEGIWRRVELICLKALIREPDFERLVIFLKSSPHQYLIWPGPLAICLPLERVLSQHAMMPRLW